MGQVFGISSTLKLPIRAGLWCLRLRLIPLSARVRGLPARIPERNYSLLVELNSSKKKHLQTNITILKTGRHWEKYPDTLLVAPRGIMKLFDVCLCVIK